MNTRAIRIGVVGVMVGAVVIALLAIPWPRVWDGRSATLEGVPFVGTFLVRNGASLSGPIDYRLVSPFMHKSSICYLAGHATMEELYTIVPENRREPAELYPEALGGWKKALLASQCLKSYANQIGTEGETYAYSLGPTLVYILYRKRDGMFVMRICSDVDISMLVDSVSTVPAHQSHVPTVPAQEPMPGSEAPKKPEKGPESVK
jgi:hypothetical protein